MDNELVERVARVLWDLSEAKVSRLQGMHPYKPDPWDSAPEFFKIAQRKEATAVLAELAGELEDAERWRYWLRKHGWSGYFDDGLTNSESAADIITAIDKARES